MFDIGFLEILVVFVLGLVVIGPERLPSTIKTCAIWFSRLKRSVQEARAEFEQQIGADEIRREIHNQQILDSMKNLGDARTAFEKKVSDLKDDIESAVGKKIEVESADIHSETASEIAPASAPELTHKNTDDHSERNHGDSTATKDEPHEPMIHDDSGADAAELPGRKSDVKSTEKPDKTTTTEQQNGKQ